MKVPLALQIIEADRHRDGLQSLVDEGAVSPEAPPFIDRLHAAEGICLTLRWLETFEAPFRQFMAQRSKDAA